MYIVNSVEAIQSIQKLSKLLAFPPVEAKFAVQLCGISSKTREILFQNVNGDEGDWGFSMETFSGMRAALSPGPGLDAMNRVMIENIASSLDDLIPVGKKVAKVKLNLWLRKIVTKATTNAVYGPQNPFKDEEVSDSFWSVVFLTP